jgi:hypothetical protein
VNKVAAHTQCYGCTGRAHEHLVGAAGTMLFGTHGASCMAWQLHGKRTALCDDNTCFSFPASSSAICCGASRLSNRQLRPALVFFP